MNKKNSISITVNAGEGTKKIEQFNVQVYGFNSVSILILAVSLLIYI